MTSISSTAGMAGVVEQAAAGDTLAFARIVSACHADMLHVAYCICGDRGQAEDAVQSAWLIAWRKLRTVRDRERVHQWLVSIAANEARRAASRRRTGVIKELAVARRAPTEAEHLDPARAIDRIDPDLDDPGRARGLRQLTRRVRAVPRRAPRSDRRARIGSRRPARTSRTRPC